MAIEMKIELSASSFPGQMRRPNPKAMLWGSCSGLSPKKRSGLNSDGFLKAFGSCVNHLHVMYRSALHCEGEKRLSVPYVWQYNGSLWYEVPVECAVLRGSVWDTYHEDSQ